MFRLIFGIFKILPWWVCLALSLLLGGLSFFLWQEYSDRAAYVETAILNGPPAPVKVGDYRGPAGDDPFGEVRLAGLLRADLGVRKVGSHDSNAFIVLDGAIRTGPLVALMFGGSDGEAALNRLVASANESGFVIVSGFEATLHRTSVASQLRINGVSREVLMVEALVGDRASALYSKIRFFLILTVIAAGLTAVAAFMAYLRFSRWRKRRRAGQAQTHASPRPTTARASASPWDAPTSPTPQSRQPAAPKRRTPEPTSDPIDTAPEPLPEFESVFPGGGSGFRFKTADQIIRETFGTVSHLDRAP